LIGAEHHAMSHRLTILNPPEYWVNDDSYADGNVNVKRERKNHAVKVVRNVHKLMYARSLQLSNQ
jgi:hypothetical protein